MTDPVAGGDSFDYDAEMPDPEEAPAMPSSETEAHEVAAAVLA